MKPFGNKYVYIQAAVLLCIVNVQRSAANPECPAVVLSNDPFSGLCDLIEGSMDMDPMSWCVMKTKKMRTIWREPGVHFTNRNWNICPSHKSETYFTH